MDDKKKLLDDLKGAAREDEAAFSVEEGLTDEELEGASGGECLCHCAADDNKPSCGGGGGGGHPVL
jgi:CDGSH-type Zn-finger protein